jgi:hypothetical protein
MVVASSIFPYQYKESSWSDATLGSFQIPEDQIGTVSPSAVHFEEAMYVAKAEYNRVHRQSGYDDKGNIPNWFEKNVGRFLTFLNAGLSGAFDPNPSGANLDGTLPLNYDSNIGAIVRGVDIPAELQHEVYIATLRDLLDDIMHAYGVDGGGWDETIAGSLGSGVKSDWLRIYKDYTDVRAASGIWFLEDTLLSTDFVGERFPSGILFDRHLDEVRLQPIPFLGNSNGAGSNKFGSTDVDFIGGQTKLQQWDFYPVRPAYLMTDGSLPSGWASGLELCYENSTSGNGGHLIPGMTISLSGGGAGLTDDWTLVSGIQGDPLSNEARPDSPSYTRFTALAPSGKASIPSGQYRLMISNLGDQVSFPWAASGTPHRSAIWPFDGSYEPVNGTGPTSVVGAFWDVGWENQTFVVTDHAFVHRQNNGQNLGSSPHLNSGVYWYTTNANGSEAMNLIDGWRAEGTINSGMLLSVALAKGDTFTAADAENASFGRIYGGGWAYDRSNNDLMFLARSGAASLSSSRASGFYSRWNQQMNFQQGAPFGAATAGGVRWHLSNAYNNAFDGTNWIINGVLTSGLDNTPRNQSAWARVNTSYNLVDGIIGPNIGWANYLRNTSEYIALDFAVISDAGDVPGKPSGAYKVVTPTWGTLASEDSTGSGSVSTTEYFLDYSSAVSGILNVSTETARGRVHIFKFFETESDNDVYCTLSAFTAGVSSGTGSRQDIFVAKLDSSSHPFQVTDAWILMNTNVTYASMILGNGLTLANGDSANFDHMEIHVNG